MNDFKSVDNLSLLHYLTSTKRNEKEKFRELTSEWGFAGRSGWWTGIAAGDFDGDGDLDVAVASFTEFVVRWYENRGRGEFTPHDIESGNQQQAYDLKATDLDGDGRLDLILAGRESRNAVWYKNRP